MEYGVNKRGWKMRRRNEEAGEGWNTWLRRNGGGRLS